MATMSGSSPATNPARFGEPPEMTRRTTFFIHKALFALMCLLLGCSQGGAQGCSGGEQSAAGNDESAPRAGAPKEAPAEAPKVASKHLGVYKVTRFQTSQDTCEQLVEPPEQPAYVALYAFYPRSNPDEARLGGGFCGDLSSCRALGRGAPEPVVGYSFIEGDDASGWRGWAIAGSGGDDADRCHATVQAHVLTSVGAQAIKIETKSVEAAFQPAEVDDDGAATCRAKDAIDAVTEDMPCKSLLVLEATREAEL